MNAEVFLDTNVLLYALSKLPAESIKARIANQLLETADFGVSTQVCQEFFVVATTKLATGISRERAVEFLKLLAGRTVAPVTPATIFKAIEIQERHRISYWDAAVVAAAVELDARILYTEDLSDGQFYGSVQVINPFREGRVVS